MSTPYTAIVILFGVVGDPPAGAEPAIAWPNGLPVYDHVVIVVEENKDYEQIIDNSNAPYLNQTLRGEGANLTRMFSEEHPSQGNYFWLFSGGNQNVGFDDKVPADPGGLAPFKAPNLGASLLTSGRTFIGFSEDLPQVGSRATFGPNAGGRKSYARKHNPWVSFRYDPGDVLATTANVPFSDFPKDPAKFKDLPTVAFVVPGLKHDMHDGDPTQSIPKGDAWLKKHLDAYYQWAKSHNSLLIVTWDESDDKEAATPETGHIERQHGPTNPAVMPTNQWNRNLQNRIPTIIAGARVKHGDFPEGKGVTHVNVLRTLEAMYGLPRAGKQTTAAAAAGIADDYIITDVFEPTL